MLEVLSAPAADLVSLADAKAWLNISDNTSDALLSSAIARASAAVQSYIGRPLLVGSYRETVEVTPLSTSISLARWPVASLSALKLDGESLDLSAVRLDAASGTLCRLDGAGRARPWTWGRAMLSVEYVAGFSAAPPDIADAVMQLITAAWSSRGRDPGLRGIGIGDITLTYNAPAAQPTIDSVAHLLSPYRQPVVG